MSLQRFMPMNIHPLLKNPVPFFLKAGAAQQLAQEACLPGGATTSWARHSLPVRKRGSEPLARLSTPPNLPFLSTVCSRSVRKAEELPTLSLWAAAEHYGTGEVVAGGEAQRFL